MAQPATPCVQCLLSVQLVNTTRSAPSAGATLIFFLVLFLAPAARAQFPHHQTACFADTITANPNRPTVANPADITQYGVLEIEYGADRAGPAADTHDASLVGLLKFGLLCDVELRWMSTSFLTTTDSAGTRHGFGDNWFGPQVRLWRQSSSAPTVSFSYAVKVPTASASKGLGSGQVDHAFTLLVSKDVIGFHLDFNATEMLVGRAVGGFDRNAQFNLAFSRPVHNKLGFSGEFYGNTQLNAATPGFVSSDWALTYSASPRLVIDGGVEVGLIAGGPRRRIFAGVTYSITNLYLAFRRNRSAPPSSAP